MGILDKSVRVLSRRIFGRILAGAVVAPFCAATEPLRPDQLARIHEKTASLSLERHYRADAQVLLLGIPVLRREAVGGGSVMWREFEAADPSRLLEFHGFSRPERAAGLNRLGFIREMARTPGKDGSECIYFGLMTSSPEESAEEARKALHSDATEHAYTAIEGHIAVGQTETAIAHFTAPAAVTGERYADLVTRAQTALAGVAKVSTADRTRATSQSFLQTLADLLMRPDGAYGHYIYSGRAYRIGLTRSPDAKATRYFRERRLIGNSTEVVRVSGRLRREAGGKETEFRLWVPGAGERPLPLRIEYQAKSYLRLVFEAANG